MERYTYAILGGGMVAGYAAREMVKQGVEPGEIVMISMDEDPPYERPPLSKGLLKGEKQEDEIFINGPGFYEEHGIDLRLKMWVRSVDLEARTVASKKTTVGFEKLLIATGAWPRELQVVGADLDGVHLLRTLAQSKAIKAAAAHADRAVVVGAGFIGLEIAAGLTTLGVRTTLVYREPRVMAGRFPEPIAQHFEGYYRERGVELIPEAEVAAIDGEERVTGVTLADDRGLPAALVVVGVGVAPETGLFEEGPLTVDDGIVANEYLETGVEGVWVAGDVARYRDLMFDRVRRFEHEDNARFQGRHVARAMLGERKPFRHVPHFYSDMFDLSWYYWGDRSLGERVVYRGEVPSGQFVAWWLAEDGRPVASFVLGLPEKEAELTKDVIRQKRPIPEEALTDTSRPLADLIEEKR